MIVDDVDDVLKRHDDRQQAEVLSHYPAKQERYGSVLSCHLVTDGHGIMLYAAWMTATRDGRRLLTSSGLLPSST